MPHLFSYILIPSLLLIISVLKASAFQHPEVEIKVLSPKGFSVSIPAESGISLFAFHGKLNEEMEELEAGTWSQDVRKPKNGRFTFTDKNTKLKNGDVLHYWTFTIHNGRGYRHDDGKFVVSSNVALSSSENNLNNSQETSTDTPQNEEEDLL
uniref:CSON002051 protein n=1 Tax=Culicoides sonorensis TaxID=179676 RepID=A0A336MP99_CULSO